MQWHSDLYQHLTSLGKLMKLANIAQRSIKF